jgi:predicted Zn-dependent protease
MHRSVVVRKLLLPLLLLQGAAALASEAEDQIEAFRRCMASPARALELMAADRAQVERARISRAVAVPPLFDKALPRLAKVARLPRGTRLELVAVPRGLGATAFSSGTIVVSALLWEGGLGLDDDEAAAILAHELAHVELSHGRIRLCEAVAAAGDETIPITQAIQRAQQAILAAGEHRKALNMMRHNHGRELEADERGAEMLRLAGYRPSAVATMLTKLARLTGANYTWSHPATETRLEQLAMKGHNAPF